MPFKIDWASLILGKKFTVFLCFTLYLRQFPSISPRGSSIWRGDLTESFMRYEFGGLYLEGLIITWSGRIFGILRYFPAAITFVPNFSIVYLNKGFITG